MLMCCVKDSQKKRTNPGTVKSERLKHEVAFVLQ